MKEILDIEGAWVPDNSFELLTDPACRGGEENYS